MRKVLLAATVAAIALVGLTANQCGGSSDTAQQPAPTPAPEKQETPPPPPAQQ
jgi:hypothetical protein